MSDTLPNLIVKPADFLVQDYCEMRQRAEQLTVENISLRQDKERLDWLETQCFEYEHHEALNPLCLGYEWLVRSSPKHSNIRAAIDAARKEAQP